jgi:hypothetical protein
MYIIKYINLMDNLYLFTTLIIFYSLFVTFIKINIYILN